jgi:hypothetical protein
MVTARHVDGAEVEFTSIPQAARYIDVRKTTLRRRAGRGVRAVPGARLSF